MLANLRHGIQPSQQRAADHFVARLSLQRKAFQAIPDLGDGPAIAADEV